MMLRQVKPVQKKIQPIKTYLQEQEKLLDEVDRILRDEFNTIKARKLVELEGIAERKSALMLKLQQNDQRIKLHPDVAKLKELYSDDVQEIKNKLISCKRLNETNGRFINICLASNRRLSAALMGVRDKLTKNMTYTEEGNTVATGPARLSVEA